MKQLSINDLVIEAMPFSEELVVWCKAYPDFKEALKLSNPDRFMPLGQILTSHTHNVPGDEVIGFYTYDYDTKIFKQDFIVNVGSNNNEFVLYTRLPNKKYGKYIKDINEFFAKYGKNGDYANSHHVNLKTIEALNHQDITDRAHRAITKGALIKKHGRRPNTQEELNDVLNKIRISKGKM